VDASFRPPEQLTQIADLVATLIVTLKLTSNFVVIFQAVQGIGGLKVFHIDLVATRPPLKPN